MNENFKISKSFKKLLDELDVLEIPKNEYVIFGSGPIAVRGLKKTDVIDIIVSKRQFDRLHKKYPQDINKHPHKCLVIGNIEIGYTWQLVQISKAQAYLKRAEIIEGYPFVPLKDALEWKENSQRKKDKKQVALIKKYLSSIHT